MASSKLIPPFQKAISALLLFYIFILNKLLICFQQEDNKMKYLFPLSCFTYDSIINTENQKRRKYRKGYNKQWISSLELVFCIWVLLHLESIECKLFIIGRFKNARTIKMKNTAKYSLNNLLKDDHKELHELFWIRCKTFFTLILVRV